MPEASLIFRFSVRTTNESGILYLVRLIPGMCWAQQVLKHNKYSYTTSTRINTHL